MDKLKKKALWGLVFVLGFLVIFAQPAAALSDWLIDKYSNYQVYFYNAEQKNCIERGEGGGGGPLIGADRAEKIWRYIAGLGIDGLSNKPEAIAGIVGNMQAESSFRPFVRNSGGCFGLIQWCSPDPLFPYLEAEIPNYTQYFHGSSTPEPPNLTEDIIDTAIRVELNYLFNVPHGNSADLYISRLSLPTNKDGVAGARAYADLFLVTVERAVNGSDDIEDPAVRNLAGNKKYQNASGRRNAAEQLYNQFKDITGSGSGEGSGGESGTVGGNEAPLPYCDEEGEDEEPGDYSDLIFYLQCDARWGNLNYGPGGIHGNDGADSTICKTGCGPTSFAVIAANLKRNSSITPDKTADLAGKAGMHVPGSGSSWGITSYLAGKYGLTAVKIGGSIAAINEYLSRGYMIHTSGRGAPPFSTGGHYIAIVKAEDGKWLVADSGSRINGPSKRYDPATVMAGMNANNVWAVKR
ncbi:C39 family peptidase [Candidatus Saccharibacteria bacterium]|nr:C39 family peptidase [Candidatus Saccharibacteria bacterium]